MISHAVVDTQVHEEHKVFNVWPFCPGYGIIGYLQPEDTTICCGRRPLQFIVIRGQMIWEVIYWLFAARGHHNLLWPKDTTFENSHIGYCILDSWVMTFVLTGIGRTRRAIKFLLKYPVGTRVITRVQRTFYESYPVDPGRNSSHHYLPALGISLRPISWLLKTC